MTALIWTAEVWVAVCTGALAFATFVLAFLTFLLHRDDDTLFSEFEKLAKLWRRFDPEINDDALRKFLEDEKHLRVD